MNNALADNDKKQVLLFTSISCLTQVFCEGILSSWVLFLERSLVRSPWAQEGFICSFIPSIGLSLPLAQVTSP